MNKIFSQLSIVVVSFKSSEKLIKLISNLDKKFKIVGNNVKVTVKDVIKPKVIIHPKSITGFISLIIKDKKAHIVVKTV